MKKGDLAFFYHSSCKVPAIVGIMEIVQEHTPDCKKISVTPRSASISYWIQTIVSAHDPSAPYHDPSSTPDNPKWSVVHVEFRQKLETPVTLKEMKEWQGQDGNPLKEMQMLKLTRLSVSKVRSEEWDFLISEMGKRGDVIEG
jgi:predicted RNA-binding protein with PUA-like domain